VEAAACLLNLTAATPRRPVGPAAPRRFAHMNPRFARQHRAPLPPTLTLRAVRHSRRPAFCVDRLRHLAKRWLKFDEAAVEKGKALVSMRAVPNGRTRSQARVTDTAQSTGRGMTSTVKARPTDRRRSVSGTSFSCYARQPAASSTLGSKAHHREVLILWLGEHLGVFTTLPPV
jgi:hypothetical protein